MLVKLWLFSQETQRNERVDCLFNCKTKKAKANSFLCRPFLVQGQDLNRSKARRPQWGSVRGNSTDTSVSQDPGAPLECNQVATLALKWRKRINSPVGAATLGVCQCGSVKLPQNGNTPGCWVGVGATVTQPAASTRWELLTLSQVCPSALISSHSRRGL